jgi:hypothetical protein
MEEMVKIENEPHE